MNQFFRYNRGIIFPSQPADPGRDNFWRLVFLLACCFIVNLATGLYFTTHLSRYFTGNALYGDALLFAGQLGFQFAFFRLFRQSNFYDYAAHVSYVSALGAAMLIFFHIGLLVFQHIGIQIEMLQPLCFGIVFTFMFYEHARRLKIMSLSPWLSATWILYRLCIYPLAFDL